MNLPKKPTGEVIEFPDPQAAIDGFIDVWLPRMVRSNQVLTLALLRVRDYCRAGAPPEEACRVLAEIENALAKATRVADGV
jgi:hypothetical protein